MNTSDYKHKMAAHCETGTVTGILNHHGLAISEPMVLGISAGIFFAYLNSPKLPFPLFVHRSKPGSIRQKISQRLGVKFKAAKHKKAQKAQEALDALIEQKIPVVVQVDMFYMEYIPKYMKVHFNGHYVTAVGRENGTYTVSDCYYPQLAEVSVEAMQQGRFSGGDLAPKGLQYYATDVPTNVDMKKPILDGIKEAAKYMVKMPVPFIGIKGMRMFGKKIVDWPKLARDEDHLSHHVMDICANLEEKGTGGAGFRFMYATFLQEASKVTNNDKLSEFSTRMMENGDKWREFSLFAAKMGKKHEFGADKFKELQDRIFERADVEEKLFNELLQTVK